MRTIIVVCLLFIFGCCSSEHENDEKSSTASRSQSKSGVSQQILKKGNGAEPQTLDPHKAVGVPAANILRDLYEGLISEAPDGDLVPGVAERWEIQNDGTVYVFYLRENAKWSNGDPVTAGDYLRGFRRAVDPLTGSKYSQILSSIVNAEQIIRGGKNVKLLGVEALAPRTLRISLKAPTPYFLGLLTHSLAYPLHTRSLEKTSKNFTLPELFVSNGAYQLSEWVVQSHIKLKRNANYWDNDETSIDEVVYYVTEDQSAELKRYRAGEIDWTEAVPLGEVRWIRQNLGDQLKVSPYLGIYYYGLNLTKPPFKNNLGLRKALSMAINREIISEKIAGLGEIPAYGWVPPNVRNYSSQSLDFRTMDRDQRITIAKQLYREAGYSSDHPLRIELRYNTSQNHKKIAIAVAAMWKEVLGVETGLVNEEWKVFLKNRKEKHKTQVFRAGWIGDYNDAYTFAELMHSNHGINDTGYTNPSYDSLLEQASTESNPDERRKLLERAERLLISEHPIIPIYFYVSKSLIKPYVDGVIGNIMDHHYSKHFRILEH